MQLAIPPNLLAASALPDSPVALQVGDGVDGLVLELLADGKVRIAIANNTVDVASQVPLEPGTTVQLAVKSTATGLVLSLVDPGGEQAAGAAIAGTAVARPAALAAIATSSALPPGTITQDMAPP